MNTPSVEEVRTVFSRLVGESLTGPIVTVDLKEIKLSPLQRGLHILAAFRSTWTNCVILLDDGGWQVAWPRDESLEIYREIEDSAVPKVAALISTVAEQFVGGGKTTFLRSCEVWRLNKHAREPEIVRRTFKTPMGYTIEFSSKRHPGGTSLLIHVRHAGVTMIAEQAHPSSPVSFTYLPVGAPPPF